MEYIAAMDFEVDQVLPSRQLQALSMLAIREKSLSEKCCDSFITTNNNQELTRISSFTKYGSLPLLRRRNSSKKNSNVKSADKENSFSQVLSLLKSHSMTRSNSASSEGRRVNNSFRTVDEPLQDMELSHSTSIENSLYLYKPSEVNNIAKEPICDIAKKSIRENSSVQGTTDSEPRNEDLNIHTKTIDDTNRDEISTQEPLTQEENLEKECLSDDDVTSNQNSEMIRDKFETESETVRNISQENKDFNLNQEESHCESEELRHLPEREVSDKTNMSISDPTSQACEEIGEIYRELSSEVNDIQSSPSEEPASNPEYQLMPNEKSYVTDKTTDDSSSDSCENKVVEHFETEENSSQQGNEISLQLSPEYDNEGEEIVGNSSSGSHYEHTSQRESSVEETSVDNEMEDIHTLVKQRRYVQTVLNSIFKANNGIALPSCHNADQTPELYNAVDNNPESPGRLGRSTPSKRRSISPSSDVTPSKKSRRENQTPRKISMITRASVAKLTRQSPNHSLYNISLKKFQIFKAAEEGDLEMVRDLLHHTGPTIRNGEKGNTLLHTAAAHNQRNVVLHLLDLISPNVVNKDGETPAHLAAKEGHTEILKILMADKEFKANKVDKRQRAFEDLLVGPLFEAVVTEDKKRTTTLTKFGADPDNNGGELVERVLARELGVTTPRQLADALNEEPFLSLLPKPCHRRLDMRAVNEQSTGPNNERKKKSNGGYFCVLNFKSFRGKTNLNRTNSSAGVNRLLHLFRKRGYKGDLHNSLTKEGTKQVVQSMVNSQELEKARCAVFVISSHSADRESFLTSDLKVLTTQWLMSLFRDSECPQLKNKPKLFIFDFDSGYHMESFHQSSQKKPVRVEEPLSDMIGLYSSNNTLTSETFGSSFLKMLCKTLRVHGADKDILDVHKELLRECIKRQCCSLPELRSFGVSKKFCLNL